MTPPHLTLPAWSHRPALDGLRTIAVYLVVAFHAEIPLFENGYIGVDLFFVLSGFLVTAVLLQDRDQHGHTRFWHFYSRRVRRLVPAALVAIVGAALLMLLVKSPIARADLVDDARASALWFSNWHFIGQESDYFAAAVGQSPYLHFWSLSIEEQFYLIFPLVLTGLAVASARTGQRWLLPVAVVGIGLLSVVLQIAMADDITRAYYGTDTRVYQLLLGAGLTIGFRALRRRRITVDARARASSTVVAAASLVLLVVAGLDVIDLSISTRGIVAALLSGAVIGALEFDIGGGLARSLAHPVLTYLGRISYGTYLWHWPIIVAVRTARPSWGHWSVFFIAALAATGVAAVSHRFIEMPLRRGRVDLPQPRVIAGALAASVLAVLLVSPILGLDVKPRFTPGPAFDFDELVAEPAETAGGTGDTDPTDDASATSESSEPATEGDSSERDPGATDPAPNASPFAAPQPVPPSSTLEMVRNDRVEVAGECRPGNLTACEFVTTGDPHVLIIGDSTARLFIPAFEALAVEHGFRLTISTFPGCPWQQGVLTTKRQWDRGCRRTETIVYDNLMDELQPDLVLTFTLGRLDDNVAEIENYDADDEGPYAGLDAVALLEPSTTDSARALLEIADHVVLVEPVPLPKADPIDCLSSVADGRNCAFEHSLVETPTETAYRAVAAADERITSLDLDDITCPTYPRCSVLDGELSIYRDPWHVWQGYYLERRGDLWTRFAPFIRPDSAD